MFWNGGAYADIGPRVTQKSGLTASGPYDIDNVSIDSYALYTNVTPAGALRGFGVPQLVWAYESHTDMMARALKLDPVEFRRKNLLREGRPHATGTIIKDAAVEKVMDSVLERMNWSKPFDKGTGVVRRGRGFGIAIKAVITPTTSVAIVNVSADGSVTLYCGTIDMGQGSDTAMAQMVGEVLNIPAETRAGGAARHRRDALRHGHARLALAVPHGPRRAARGRGRARQAQGAGARGRRAGRLEHSGPRAVREEIRHAGRQRDRHRHLQAGLHPARAGHRAVARTSRAFWMVSGAGAEVEVDTETGHVKITKLVNVVDVGKAINPRIVETQISGAALMQLGFTMFEKMHIDGGQVTNASLADYKIPGFHDVPVVMDNSHVDTNQSNGPFGAKGVGEVATFCVSPAIANAIDDAVGVRLTELPLNPEAVYPRDPRQGRQAAGGRVMTAAAPSTSSSTARRSRPTSSRTTTWSSCCRAQFALTGARETCGQGLCGCCTVLVNGRAVSGCLYLAAFVDGAEVTTVEASTRRRSCIRCRRRSSRPARSSAATARPASC